MVKSNGFQGSRVLNSSNKTIANVYQANSSAKEYFSLKQENNRLAIENAILHNFLKSNYLVSPLQAVNYPCH